MTALVLVFVVAANALPAGYSFMTEPDGAGLKAPVSLLRFSPFSDFFIPGLILFTVNGILNLVTGILIILKGPFRYWLLAAQGVLLAGWIFVQVLMLRDFNWLHFIFAAVGLFLFTSGIYLEKNDRPVNAGPAGAL